MGRSAPRTSRPPRFRALRSGTAPRPARAGLPRALLLALLLAPPAARADEGFAPQPPRPAAHFRGDFALTWAITDGQGMADHAALTGTFGPQIDATPSVGFAPVVLAAAGVAEGGHPSLRVGGGLEVALRVLPAIELVPAVLGGYLRQRDEDRRAGPFLKLGLAVRLLADDDFFVVFEPLAFLLLPPPPGGFTRYGSKIAVDATIVRFGGRTP